MGAGTSGGGTPQQPQSFGGGQSNPYAPQSPSQMQPSQTANPFVNSPQQSPQPYPNPYAAQQQSQSRQLPEWLSQLFNNYGQQQQQGSNPYASQTQQPQQQSQYYNPYQPQGQAQPQSYYNPYQPQGQAQPQQAQAPTTPSAEVSPAPNQAETSIAQPNAFTPGADTYPQAPTQSGLGALQQHYGFAIDPYMPPVAPTPVAPTPVAPTPVAPTPFAAPQQQGGEEEYDPGFNDRMRDAMMEYRRQENFGLNEAGGGYQTRGEADPTDSTANQNWIDEYKTSSEYTGNYRSGGLAALVHQ